MAVGPQLTLLDPQKTKNNPNPHGGALCDPSFMSPVGLAFIPILNILTALHFQIVD